IPGPFCVAVTSSTAHFAPVRLCARSPVRLSPPDPLDLSPMMRQVRSQEREGLDRGQLPDDGMLHHRAPEIVGAEGGEGGSVDGASALPAGPQLVEGDAALREDGRGRRLDPAATSEIDPERGEPEPGADPLGQGKRPRTRSQGSEDELLDDDHVLHDVEYVPAS